MPRRCQRNLPCDMISSNLGVPAVSMRKFSARMNEMKSPRCLKSRISRTDCKRCHRKSCLKNLKRKAMHPEVDSSQARSNPFARAHFYLAAGRRPVKSGHLQLGSTPTSLAADLRSLLDSVPSEGASISGPRLELSASLWLLSIQKPASKLFVLCRRCSADVPQMQRRCAKFVECLVQRQC
jgi:hypothetical protein